jgi:GNAT superfamily N-acetyltransferase
MVGPLSIVRVNEHHDRATFDCGSPPLNDFLRRYARQNEAAGISRTYVATAQSDQRHVLGYYSLAATSVAFEKLPSEATKRLPRYPVPAALLARLAVDRRAQGRGIGGLLIADAYKRALAAADVLGVALLVIHAKDEAAKRFYARFNALPLADNPLHLIVDMRVIRAAVDST